MCDFQRALFLLDFTCPEKKSYKAVPHQKVQTFTLHHYFTKSAKAQKRAVRESVRAEKKKPFPHHHLPLMSLRG